MTTLARGFADPDRDGARAFRVALDAMARPGTVGRLTLPQAPAGLGPAAAALLLVLADAETAVAYDNEAEAAATWAAFHTGAPRGGPADATFAVGRWSTLLPLHRWRQGTPDYPDASATLIVVVDALDGGPALRLGGPGIDGHRTVAPALPADAVAALADNAAGFPLGVDVFFTAGDRMMALPRSTRIAGGALPCT